MNSGIIPQRVTTVAPTLAASPAGPLRPVSARSYQSTAKTPSSAIRGPTNTEEEEEILLELIEECERVNLLLYFLYNLLYLYDNYKKFDFLFILCIMPISISSLPQATMWGCSPRLPIPHPSPSPRLFSPTQNLQVVIGTIACIYRPNYNLTFNLNMPPTAPF